MKVLKGIFIYTMLIIGAVFVVGILLLGGMYLFKWSLFGYTFKNINIQTDRFASININSFVHNGQAIENDNPRIKFVIDSGVYSVRIQPDKEGSQINYYTVSDFTGFVKSTDKVYTPAVTTSLSMKDGCMIVNMKVANPEGAISFDKERNRIVIVVPEIFTKTESKKEISYYCDITTTKGSITLKNSVTDDNKFNAPLRVKSLVAKTETGNITLGGFDRDGNNAKTDVTLDNIILSTKRGIFDFSSFTKLTIKEKFVLNSDKADYIFDTLVAKNGVEILGNNILLKANEITCENGDFVFKSASGGVQVGTINCSNYTKEVTAAATETVEEKYHYKENGTTTLNNVSIFTENANIVIKNLMGKTRIDNIYGSITIDLLCNQASIKNENSNITIKKSGVLPANDGTTTMTETSSMVIYNTYGNIDVKEYYQNGLFTNVKGSITLNSAFNSMKSVDEYYYTKVVSKDGNVELTTAGNPYTIEATDKANVTIVQNGIKKLSNDSETKQVYYAKTTNGNLSANLPTLASKAGNGYIVLVDGGLASTPVNTFANLKAHEYRYYMIGGANTTLSNTVVAEADLEGALASYPLIKLQSSKTYVYAQD